VLAAFTAIRISECSSTLPEDCPAWRERAPRILALALVELPIRFGFGDTGRSRAGAIQPEISGRHRLAGSKFGFTSFGTVFSLIWWVASKTSLNGKKRQIVQSWLNLRGFLS